MNRVLVEACEFGHEIFLKGLGCRDQGGDWLRGESIFGLLREGALISTSARARAVSSNRARISRENMGKRLVYFAPRTPARIWPAWGLPDINQTLPPPPLRINRQASGLDDYCAFFFFRLLFSELSFGYLVFFFSRCYGFWEDLCTR